VAAQGQVALLDDAPERVVGRVVIREQATPGSREVDAAQPVGVTPYGRVRGGLDVPGCGAETYRAKDKGFYAVYMPTVPPPGTPLYNDGYWEPLWAAIEETGLVLTIHIGTDGETTVFRGPGGAVMNYVETTYGGQRATTQLISGGALDRHTGLRVLIAEGGAAWAPFLGDRMNEGYRQHGMFVRPTLSLPPKDYIYRQVYVSFQHDVTAVPALTAMGYQNVMWGSDYHHLEGTYGHTQKTLHELFDGVDEKVRHRITVGAFLDLFPHIGEPRGDEEEFF
jgi:hypothetical protein